MGTFLPLDDQATYVRNLQRLPGLETFHGDYLSEMFRASELREYDEGEMIIAEGTLDRTLYFLLLGEVQVLKQGKEVARISDYGEMFGEVAVIKDEHRTASVVAATPCYCLSVDATFLDKLDDKQKFACLAVIHGICAKVLSDRLEKTTAKLVRLEKELARVKLG